MLRGESLIDYIYGDFNEVYDMMMQTQDGLLRQGNLGTIAFQKAAIMRTIWKG